MNTKHERSTILRTREWQNQKPYSPLSLARRVQQSCLKAHLQSMSVNIWSVVVPNNLKLKTKMLEKNSPLVSLWGPLLSTPTQIIKNSMFQRNGDILCNWCVLSAPACQTQNLGSHLVNSTDQSTSQRNDLEFWSFKHFQVLNPRKNSPWKVCSDIPRVQRILITASNPIWEEMESCSWNEENVGERSRSSLSLL